MLRRAALLVSALSCAPLAAEEAPTATSGDAANARRREARELAWRDRWDEAAAAFLELAAAKGEGWEADARDARASAACAAAARGDRETARAAFASVLAEDPANLIARAGLSALAEAPSPPPAPAEAPPAPEDPDALYAEAQALAREGKLLAARERLRRSLRVDPGGRAVEKSLPRLQRDILRQVEESLHRHDRPQPSPLPDERLHLRRADQARREGHLPEDAPLKGPLGERLPARRLLLADAEGMPPLDIPAPTSASGDPQDAEPTEAERAADLAHGLAQASTLAKSEAFDLAEAVLEALRAAHPEAAREIRREIEALADARLRAEDARKAREREAAQAEERRGREEAEAREAAAEARRVQAYEAGLKALEASDWTAARASFDALQESDPGYRDVPDLLRRAVEGQAGAAAEARGRALADAKAALEAGRFEEARAALAPLDPKEGEVPALLSAIAEGEARRTREESQARTLAEAGAREAAVQAALRSAGSGDFKEARAQLFELRTQHPDDPRIGEALARVAALEAAPRPAPAAPPRDGRRASAGLLREARERAQAAASGCAEGRKLYFAGRLEEARERFQGAAAADPSGREARRYLARIEREIRARAESGAATEAPPPAPSGSSDARCRKALALYDSGDLALAEPLLRELAGDPGLGWWQRRRVGRALADIEARRASVEAAAAEQASRAASEEEARRLREAAYFLDTGRAEDARRALSALLSGPVSEEARREAEALKARLPAR